LLISFSRQETWQPAPDLDSELPARRSLLERSATADQTFGDVRNQSRSEERPLLTRCTELFGADEATRSLYRRPVNSPRPDTSQAVRLRGRGRQEPTPRQLQTAPEDPNLMLHVSPSHASPFGNTFRDDPHLPTFLPLSDQTTLDYGLSAVFLENADLRAIDVTRTGTDNWDPSRGRAASQGQ
jgi:hypothetical protein